MRTIKTCYVKFRDFHNVTIPGGSELLAIDHGGLIHYAANPALVEVDGPRGPGSMWAHDTKYFYIWVPTEALPPGA